MKALKLRIKGIIPCFAPILNFLIFLRGKIKKYKGRIRLYQQEHLHRNVNRLFDTNGMNRISGKPLKTRDSGTLSVAGIPCLLLLVFLIYDFGQGGVHF